MNVLDQLDAQRQLAETIYAKATMAAEQARVASERRLVYLDTFSSRRSRRNRHGFRCVSSTHVSSCGGRPGALRFVACPVRVHTQAIG